MRPAIPLLLLLLSACSFGEKARYSETIEEAPKGTFVEYEIKALTERAGPCKEDSTQARCIDFRIDYPVITAGASAAVLETMNQSIQRSIFQYAFIDEQPDDFQSLINEISEEYESIANEFPDYESSWLLEVNSDIIFQDSAFISVASTIYSFTGGAHPNSSQVYRSYNLNTGEPIGLEDILEAGYELDLNEAAEVEFRMAKQIPPSRGLNEEGYYFEDNKFKLNNNFAIIEKSLLFYFNPYEIAPYALGATELELKLTDYVKLIKDGSVIEDLKN